jgi:hypothetical protein
MHQTAGLLLLISAGLMLALHRSNAIRVGSLWLIGYAVLGFMLSFALRDVIRRLGHRATEERIIRDLRTYMHGRLGAAPVVHNDKRQTEPPQPQAAIQTVVLPGDAFVPCRAAAFLELRDSKPLRVTSEDLVVFDAIPPLRSVEIRMNLFAVLMPVCTTGGADASVCVPS